MSKKIKGRIYLVPTPLSEDNLENLSPEIKSIVSGCTHFLVESFKMGRRHIKSINPLVQFDQCMIEQLDKHTPFEELPALIQPVLDGHDLCILSDAGSPVIADPGSNMIRLAHDYGIQVSPLSGPSSIMLALIGSGFNGQQFTFHGYLSRDKGKLRSELKKVEAQARQGVTQIFMETPYRNLAIFRQILTDIKGDMRLCVACDITSKSELIEVNSIASWKSREEPDLHKRPCIFLLSQR